MTDIKWSKYIPISPSSTQLSFLLLPHLEAFFGGAAGGGKSVVLLAGALQYVNVPGYAALILRRTLTELKQPMALLDLAKQWLSGTDARYDAEEHTYSFPTSWPSGVKMAMDPPPAKIQFGYLGEHQAEIRYQGAAYQYVGIDEVTHFENDSAPTYLFSRLRKNVCPIHKLAPDPDTGDMAPNYVKGCNVCDMYKSLPIRFRTAANPGGPGHYWVKDRYKIEKEIYKDSEGQAKIRWIGKNPQAPFMPSSLRDNLFLDQQSYRQSLSHLDEIRRQQLEDGDWDVSPDSRFNARWAKFYTSKGDYFQLGPYVHHVSDLQKIFITVDPAASTKEGMIDTDVNPKKGPSYSVISVWGLTKDFQLIWMHMKRFREEIPFLIESIKDSYQRFRPEYVAVETNGLGIGPAQILMSKGLKIVNNRKNRDKIQNASNAIYRMKKGRVWLPEKAPWLKTCMDEIFTWTGHPGLPDDIVDTLSDACNIVTDLGRDRDPLLEKEITGRISMPDSSPYIGQMRPSSISNRSRGDYHGSTLYNPSKRSQDFWDS